MKMFLIVSVVILTGCAGAAQKSSPDALHLECSMIYKTTYQNNLERLAALNRCRNHPLESQYCSSPVFSIQGSQKTTNLMRKSTMCLEAGYMPSAEQKRLHFEVAPKFQRFNTRFQQAYGS